MEISLPEENQFDSALLLVATTFVNLHHTAILSMQSLCKNIQLQTLPFNSSLLLRCGIHTPGFYILWFHITTSYTKLHKLLIVELFITFKKKPTGVIPTRSFKYRKDGFVWSWQQHLHVSHLELFAGCCGQTVDLRSPVSGGFIERDRGVNCRDINRTRSALALFDFIGLQHTHTLQ